LCGTALNAVRGLRLRDIADDIAPILTGWDEDGVQLTWTTEDHPSSYRARWLRDHCYSPTEIARRKHRPTLWDASIADRVATADFEQVRNDPAARLEMLQTICDFGFCKIVNAPREAEQALALIETVGRRRDSHYGTYTLTGKESVDNVGDVTFELPPHCDETYRLSTIGITVFQVLRPSRSGGHSTLVDGFEAVRRLRARAPEDFERLTRTPICAERFDKAVNSDGVPRWFVARMPPIRLDRDGQVCGVRMNERQIAPLEVPEGEIAPMYRALKRLYAQLYDPALRLTFPLQAGEGLIFNNQRVLHGRTAYEAENPPRAVLTSSVDLEEFHSSLRMLRSQLFDDPMPMAYGQGMVV
jgi:alpha-ketoglutarate-dependent taurine dioxygenase